MAHSTNKRNNANTSNTDVRDVNTSGFDLSYKSKNSGRIGMRQLVGYEYILAGDKVRLSTSAKFQFQPTSSPMLPAMDMRIEHTYIPFRNVNNDWEDMNSFVKGEAWNLGSFPKVTINQLIDAFGSIIPTDTPATWRARTEAAMLTVIQSMTNNFKLKLRPYFIEDYADTWSAHARRIISGYGNMSDAAKEVAVCELCYSVMQYFIGDGSALDTLNAPIVNRSNIFSRGFFASNSSFLNYCKTCVGYSSGQAWHNAPIDVMSLRALYADWFETTRDSNLEPAKSLPRYHKLGNAVENIDQIVYCYLVPRFALLSKDIWTTANVDSPYRHVVAPIIADSHDVDFSASDIGVQQYQLSPLINTDESTPRPTDGAVGNNLGVYRNLLTSTVSYSTYGLDLVALKRAKQAKDWLMRGHIFGDEYQDSLLAHYGVKLDDARINKPFYLGGTSEEVNIDTTVNPTATSEMAAGERNASMTSNPQTDSFDFVAQETGLVLTWLYIVPAVTYTPYESRMLALKATDFPQPELSNDSEEISFAMELDRGLAVHSDVGVTPFGRHPYAHQWRSRVDENHGQFLYEYQPYTFRRVFEEAPALNAAFIHTHVNLDFMVDTDAFNPCYFGTINHKFFVVRKLPIVTDQC